jgi:hypothetical protein
MTVSQTRLFLARAARVGGKGAFAVEGIGTSGVGETGKTSDEAFLSNPDDGTSCADGWTGGITSGGGVAEAAGGTGTVVSDFSTALVVSIALGVATDG